MIAWILAAALAAPTTPPRTGPDRAAPQVDPAATPDRAAPPAAPATAPQAAPGTTPERAVAGAARPSEGASPPAEPVTLASAGDARRVCEAATPVERVAFGGGVVDAAEAEAKHDAGREQALGARYRAEFAGERLRFASWAPDDRRLALASHSAPVTRDGALRLDAVEDPELPVEADAATVRRILAAQRDRSLALRVTFALAGEDDAPCFHVPGASAWTISAEPIAWEYVAGDQVLARGGTGADRPTVSARSGATPRVRVGSAVDASGRELRPPLLEHAHGIEGCYARALDRDPYLDGAIVADVDLHGRRAPERVRIAADSTNDDGLVTCVRDVLASLDLRGSGRAYLPIHFELEPPAQPGGSQ